MVAKKRWKGLWLLAFVVAVVVATYSEKTIGHQK
jgi:hypothetical protein